MVLMGIVDSSGWCGVGMVGYGGMGYGAYGSMCITLCTTLCTTCPYVIHAIMCQLICPLLSLLGIALHVLHFVYTFILSDIIDLKSSLRSLSWHVNCICIVVMKRIVKRICANCQGFMGYREVDNDLPIPVSHGICNDCLPLVYPEVYDSKGTLPNNNIIERHDNGLL